MLKQKRTSTRFHIAGRAADAIKVAVFLCGFLPLAASAATPSTGVVAKNPWMRYLLASRPVAGYVTLTNTTGHDKTIIKASAPGCRSMVLHNSVIAHNMVQMKKVSSITIKAHQTLKLQPGSYHLMCMDPAAILQPGATEHITLTYKNGQSQRIDFVVKSATGR